jgi:hypothetical protein
LAKSLSLELSSQEQLAALKRLDTEKPGAFRTIADFAFAEAFDSFYCSKASRETASDLAPKSQELLAALMEEGPPPAGNPKNERLAGSAGIEKLLHLAQTMPDIEVGLSAAGAAAVLAKLRTSETVGFNLDWNSFYNWFNTTSSYAGPSYVSEFAGGAHAGAGIALTYPRIQERNQLLNGFYNGDAGRPSHDPRGAAFDRREQIYNSGSNPRVRAARYVGDNW